MAHGVRALGVSIAASLGACAAAGAVVVACGSSGGSSSGGVPPGDASSDGAIDAPIALDGGSEAGEDVVPRLGRTFALDINPASDGNYLMALAIAKDAGVQAVNLTIDWSAIDEVPDGGLDGGGGGDGGSADGGDAITYFNANLHIANLIFAGSTKVALAIRAVDTTGPTFPPDLTGRALDDPELTRRYNLTQDYVFGEIPDLALSMYVIGNEIDIPFGADATKWAAYKTFFDGAADHAHSLRAGVKVGSTVTLAGALAHPELVAPALANADFLGITYYPLNSDFTVRPTSVVRADVDELVAQYPSTPIFFREAGYPSSAADGSSEAQQAAFVQELFRAWDAHAAQIPLVTFFTMNDYSPQAVASFGAYYGSTDPKFLAYLGSLGLRTYAPGTGANKPGWDALVQGTRARGW